MSNDKEAEWEAYEKLPTALRAAVQDFPIALSARDLVKGLEAGYSPEHLLGLIKQLKEKAEKEGSNL